MNREQVDMKEGDCPDCGGNLFHPGPRGGCAHNVMCVSCHAKFWVFPPFQPERIRNEDAVYNLQVARTLDEITMRVLE